MSTGMILIILLIVLLLASIPQWPYSRGWGYYPSGLLTFLVVVVLLLILFRVI